jgi:hypothetical protein
LVAYWRPGEDEPWYLIRDKTVGRYALKIYQRRFWTERTFRDFKSQGWSLEDSELSQPRRFERLLLMIALAYVWLVQIGAYVIKRGLQRWVDRRCHRTLSYFRLGLSWLNRLLGCGKVVDFSIYAFGSAK